MARAVFFTIPARGHVNPALPLIAALQRAGVELMVYSTPRYRERIEATGASFQGYTFEDRSQSFATRAGRMGYLARTLAETNLQVFETERDRVRAYAPDFVVHDSTAVWGKYLAGAVGVPGVCLCAMFVATPEARRVAWRSGYRMGGLREVVAAARHALTAMGIGRRFRRRTGMPSHGFAGLFTAYQELNVVCTSRELQPGGETLGDSWFFTGPNLDDEPASRDASRIDPPADRPLVVVTAGTTFADDLGYFRDAVAALVDGGAFVAISTGGVFDPRELGELPADVVARSYLPFAELFTHAKLFVGHGGMGSLSMALAAGVPLVVVPQILEQAVNGRRVQELGAGVCIPRHRLTPDRLSEAVATVLADPSYHTAATRLGDSLRRAAGMDAAAGRILDHAGAGTGTR